MDNQGVRLKKIIDKIGLTNVKFAELLDISPNYVSMIISNKKNLSSKLVYNITKVIPNLNTEWLENGTGEMFIDNIINEPFELYKYIDPEERKTAISTFTG